MKKKKTRIVKRRFFFTKFELLLYGFTLFLIVVSPLAIVFSQATLSKINYDVERLKSEVTSQERTNESLSMKISELASLEKIQEVADAEGLKYNNSNIKSVNTSE